MGNNGQSFLASTQIRATLLAALAAVVGIAGGIVGSSHAQVWDESANGGGDAGNLVTTGQITTGQGALPTIGGTIVNTDFDIDLYCIKITDPATFSASVFEPNKNLPVHLWLFDQAGNGVAQAADDTVPYTPTIPGSLVSGAGVYFIGISRPGLFPQDAGGTALFPPLVNGSSGPNAAGPLDSWGGVGCCFPGPYAIKLEGAFYHDPGLGGGGGPWWKYTNFPHFGQGNLFNLETYIDPLTGDQCIRLKDQVQAWPFVGIANSARGTLTRIAVQNMPSYGINEGDVVGEYYTAPNTMQRDPSRTTVDGYGNIWVGNRQETGVSGGQNKGSATRIGLALGGTRTDAAGVPNPTGQYLMGPFQYCSCEDRDGDGLIKTALGYPHTTGQTNVDWVATYLNWSNAASADTNGGVSTAEDECITAYVRTEGTNVRHVSIDGQNDIWLSGTGNREWELVDGSLAVQVGGTMFHAPTKLGNQTQCGSYGGLVDSCGVVWSTTWGNLFRYDPSQAFSATNPQCFPIPSYGTSFDDATCHVWAGYAFDGNVREISSFGSLLNTYPHGSTSLPRGVAVNNGLVYVAHSTSNTIGVVTTAGVYCGNIVLNGPFGTIGTTPHGVAADTNDKIWSANNQSHNAMRIDPSLGACGQPDLTVDLGTGANPYNYSDMTGDLLLKTAPQGSWTFIHDSGTLGTNWGTLDWNAITTGGSQVLVRVRASDSPIPTGVWTDVFDNVPFTGVTGRYLQVQVTLKRGTIMDPTGCCRPAGEAIFCDVMICQENDCDVKVDEVYCNPQNGGLVINGTVFNNSGVTATKLLITPLPIGGPITFVPNVIPVNIPNTGSGTFSTTAFGWTNGQPFCFKVTLLDAKNQVCCTSEACVTPDCDCLQIRKKTETIKCDPFTGNFTYTFQLDNLVGGTIYHIYLLPPSGVTFTPNYFPFPGGIPNGSSTPPLTVTISGATPGTKLCFDVTIHDEQLVECCGRQHCIDLPECFAGGGNGGGHGNGTGAPGLTGPDWIHLDAGLGLLCADTATLTIMNHAAEPRIFDWKVLPSNEQGYNFQVPAGGIAPSSGTTLPIPSGGYIDIPIQISPGVFPEDNAFAALDAVIVHQPSGFAVRANGQLMGPKMFDGLPPQTARVNVCSSHPEGIVKAILGAPTPLSFFVANNSSAPVAMEWRIDTSGPFVSLNGLPPGTPIKGVIDIQPGAATPVPFEAALAGLNGAPRVHDIMFSLRPTGGYPTPPSPASVISMREDGDSGCYADCDADGALTINDFICFQTLFALGEPTADCDGDAQLTIDDFICFQTYFAIGC